MKRTQYPLRTISIIALLSATAACGDGDEQNDVSGADVVSDAADGADLDDAEADAVGDTGSDGDAGGSDADDAGGGDATEDAEGDGDAPTDDTGDTQGDGADDAEAEPAPLEFALNWPIFAAPADPLVGTELESCAVYEEEACVGGTVRRCDIYDTEAEAFDEDPDAMLRRAYLYDRWYDLFSSPDGQTVERVFTTAMPPGTPESVWADPANLAGWSGAGDSAIWTGTALNGFILRYLHTGTEADYQRMEEKTRVMLNFFEVTGIPGYLARYHYLETESGGPVSPDHLVYGPTSNPDHRDIPDPESMEFLPDAYFELEGTPRWSGDPSIDQMNGPMVAFPMVYGLLRDEELKDRIAYQMTCYLHRLRRIEVRNLQSNPQALEAITSLFSSGRVQLDPDDIDPSEVDDIVMYVHPQINTSNESRYDTTCPDFIQTEPWRVLDATESSFVLDLIELASDMRRELNRPNHINHFYLPNVRGGDAIHMMHLTLMAYAFTGDERYADFLRDELLTGLRTAEVAATMSAALQPQFCRRFYGTNIIAGPLWAFLNLLGDSELDAEMQRVMRVELWQKEAWNLGNANIELMFAGTVTPEVGGEDRAAALAEALEILPEFGGNGGVIDDPRRTYARSYDEAVAALPEGIEPRCATELERALCEEEISVFGVPIPPENISFECTGATYECVMEDDLCTRAEASAALPPPLRRWADYTWQRSPFDLGEDRGDGRTQSPGTDYTEQYWMARFYDFIEGEREVLAWRDTGESCGAER